MSPIPWAAILSHGPTLVAAARRLLATAEEKSAAIDARLDQLQKVSQDSARLLQDMAQQLEVLAIAQRQLARKLWILLAVAAVASILAIGAILVALTG
jgi:hypothetical protein